MSKYDPTKWRRARPASPSRGGQAAPDPSGDATGRRAATDREKLAVSASAAGGPTPGRELIATRAYALWEARGRPEGTDVEDWLEAERSLGARVG